MQRGSLRPPLTTITTSVSYAASAESPESTSTCRIHVLRGLPLARLHCCLLSGLRPDRVSTARCRAAWAGASSGSRRVWPNTAMRRLRMREMMLSSLVWSNTVVLVTKWYHCISRIRRWQDICEMPQVAARLFVVAPTSCSHTEALIQHKHCTALI